MKTNIQLGVEKERAVYTSMPRPLLAQLCLLHGLSIRDFAQIFEISKSHAQEILNHQKMPSLELAFRIARYFECTTDELFGWMVDDDGMRRPLLVEIPGKGEVWRLKHQYERHKALVMIRDIAEYIRKKRTQEESK